MYVLFVLVILSGCLPPQGDYISKDCSQTFMISVTSTPNGAEVYLNNNFLGITPLHKSRIKVDYNISTSGLFFASTGWSVGHPKEYYLFVKKNGYKTVIAKLGIVDVGSKLRLRNNKYNFELKNFDTTNETEFGQLEIRRILTSSYSSQQEFELVKNTITDFLTSGFRNPEYFRISKEKVSVTKNSFNKVRVLSSPQSVCFDFSGGPFLNSDIAQIDSGEENNRTYPTFGLFIDGELLSTAVLVGSRHTAGTLAFPYPWEWDDGRLLEILKKLGLTVFKGNKNKIISLHPPQSK
jgi:hypothetical protein